MQCPNCGFDNPTEMRFCGKCGTRLDAVAPAEDSAPAPVFDPTPGKELIERYRRAAEKAAGQRRSVTVLFADLSGYTSLAEKLDSEDVYFLIQEYLKLMADTVYRYEGFVDKYTGDGLMALFGAPIAQERHAEMAVRAALEMQAALSRMSSKTPLRDKAELFMRIGLNAGNVVVGNVGSDLQMNYTAIGDTVNLANRLEQAARPGTILVSESVFLQSRAVIDYFRLPPQAFKGLSRLVQAFQVVGLRERPRSVRGLEGLRAPMIGREAELARLRAALDLLLEQKKGGLIVINGEAGLGKTRLISESKITLPVETPLLFEGHCLTYRRTISYWVFLDALRRVLDVDARMDDGEVQERLSQRLRHILGERAADVLPALERAMSLRPSNALADERFAQLDAGQQRQRIFLAFRDWLVAEARSQPLLLVLEDLHWADDASLELLQFLADSIRDEPLLIFATTRPFHTIESATGALQRICERAEKRLGDQYGFIRLEHLSPDQTEKLLNNLLALTLPETLRAEILLRSAGNPFYLEEILRMLMDQGIIRREGNQLQLTPGADLIHLGVPETLKGLILSRFDRLEADQRRFLQAAAAIGRQFNLPLLRQVTEMPDEALESALAVLVEREFILPVETAAENEYQFQHVLVSDAIYSTLLDRQRAEIHASIGAAIEQLYADHLDDQVEALAQHFLASERRDRALYYLLRGARQAAASFLNQQAYQYYDEALKLLPEVPHSVEQQLQAHSGIGDMLLFLGEYSKAREHFQTAVGLTDQLALGQQMQARSNLERQIGATYERQGDYEQALRSFNAAQSTLTAVSSRFPVERARVLNEIGWTHFRRGQLDEAEKYLQRALWSVEPSTQPGVVASIYNRLGGVFYVKDDLTTASEYVRKSLDLRIETGDVAGVARTYNNLGLLEWRRGNWDEAIDNFTRSVELHAVLNDVEGTAEVHFNIGLLLTDRGSLDEAQTHLDEALRSAQQIGHSFLEGLGHMHLAHYWLVRKAWNKTLDYGQRGIAIFTELGSQENLIDTYVSVGEAWLGLADLGRAGETSTAINALLTSDDTTPSLQKGRALRLEGSLRQAQGDLEAAQTLFDQSAEQFTRLDNQLELGRTLARLALLSQQLNDPVAAGSNASQARAIFSSLGAQLDLQIVEEWGL